MGWRSQHDNIHQGHVGDPIAERISTSAYQCTCGTAHVLHESFGKCVCVCVSGRWVQSLQWHEFPLNHESTLPHLGGMKLHLHCQKCCLKHPKTIKDNKRILNMCYKNAILTLTNWNHPWLGFMAKLHTQRGLRGFLLDEPPADWSNHKWKDHEASNGKNMSCNCFPGVLLLQHSLIGWRPWHLQIFGKTSLGCLYHVYLQGAHVLKDEKDTLGQF